MDLLAPCRSCLQCLPFFNLSPPARVAAAAPSSPPPPHLQDASEATSIDPAQTSENLPSPSAAPAVQEQGLCPDPIKGEEDTQAMKCEEDDALQNFDDQYSIITETEAVPASGIVIAPPVSSSPPSAAYLPEDANDNKPTTLPELPLQVPFINDVTFLAPGFLPLESPMTPAPFGAAGYPAGQYPPPDQIYQYQHHGHSHSHHAPGHAAAHDGQVPQPSHLHAGDDEVPQPADPPSDNLQVIHEVHEDASHHNSPHQSHDSTSVDDVGETVIGHTSLDGDHNDKLDDISPTTPPLEVSQSTPDLVSEVTVGGENSAASHTNGASDLLETYHSEPVVLSGDPHDDDVEAHNIELFGHSGSNPLAHRRRRDHFRDQLKGIKQQIKEGGHHLREEGSKHMQTIIENMNKQAQQIEQSGSFFMVPRVNNN